MVICAQFLGRKFESLHLLFSACSVQPSFPSSESEMELFKESFSTSGEYPKNLLSIDDCCYNVEEYYQRLAETREATRLFGDESDALVDCLELENALSGKN